MFRAQMPRIHELRDLIADPASADAYFQNFDENVRESPHHVKEIYLRREKELQGLDPDSWKSLKSEASQYWYVKTRVVEVGNSYSTF